MNGLVVSSDPELRLVNVFVPSSNKVILSLAIPITSSKIPQEVAVPTRYCQLGQDTKSSQESLGRFELHDLVQLDNARCAEKML